MRSILLGVLLASCAAPSVEIPPDAVPVVTYGELMLELSEHYCAEQADCGNIGGGAIARCVRHSVSHTCELAQTCDIAVTQADVDRLAECVLQMDAITETKTGCNELLWGFTPDVCQPLYRLQD